MAKETIYKIKVNRSKKIHKEFIEKLLKKEKIPCTSIGMISKKNGDPKFLEVILRRPERYSHKGIMKLIPKEYEGVKVKSF